MTCMIRGTRRAGEVAIRVYLTGRARMRLLGLIEESGRTGQEILALALDLFFLTARDQAAMRGFRRLKAVEAQAVRSVGEILRNAGAAVGAAPLHKRRIER